MELIVAIVLAIVFGGLQFFLLWKGIRSMANHQLKIFYFVAQFFCPLVALGLCVWLAKDWLVLSASIICGILVVGAIAYKVYMQKQERRKV
ncbi:hypothetical protein [Chakrabartyella piscis]|uniref:hypothetical protein n=1 Tax=Chakrabartyella piscis TaxID=2918914 RepID=UPI002958947C|nr:hypothetical protein [Chakrabartyella piscis]